MFPLKLFAQLGLFVLFVEKEEEDPWNSDCTIFLFFIPGKIGSSNQTTHM